MIMKTPINFLLSLTLSLFSMTFSQAQSEVYGTVRDAETGSPLIGATVLAKGTSWGVLTDNNGQYQLQLPPGKYHIEVAFVGYESFESKKLQLQAGIRLQLDVALQTGSQALDEVAVTGYSTSKIRVRVPGIRLKPRPEKKGIAGASVAAESRPYQPPYHTENYSHIVENNFKEVLNEPLSTFSIDVDRAAYANVRRFLRQNQLPPPDAVRIEELVNYFSYDYPQPKGVHPFAIHTEIARAPWKQQHWLLQIGIKGRELEMQSAPPNNLVFLLDVSGSMNSPDKLPLLKQAFQLLINEMRPQDRMAIVVYAGAAGLVLPSTPGSQKERIRAAIERLEAGGSTAGGAGIQLAYQTALDHYLENGNNRVILATDGDFNVGISSEGGLVRLIEEKRKAGVYLTVLGFGTGNYQDAKMEQLADKGNGNYAYIDNVLEAKKVLVKEMSGTLYTIAKDVKIQIEFNPQHVKAYRLIGYENRLLNKEDFNDDTKDAGELGAGHTVTALYELIPATENTELASVDPLKYQQIHPTQAANSEEVMTIKFRYKAPEASESTLMLHTLEYEEVNAMNKASANLRFASAVAEFGMLLRDSKFREQASFESLIARARSAKGKDEEGYRAEFIHLAETASLLKSGGAQR